MEPQIFYCHYDSLLDFYKRFVKDKEFWLSDLVVTPDAATENHEEHLLNC